MFAFFDRQKQRQEKLTAAIVAADDRTLAAVLGRGGAAEIAVALRVLPLARANALVQAVSNEVLAKALALTEAGRDPDPQAAAKLVAELTQQLEAPAVDPQAAAAVGGLEIRETPTAGPAAAAPAGPAVEDAPLGVRALDIAGRMLGTFSVDDSKT